MFWEARYGEETLRLSVPRDPLHAVPAGWVAGLGAGICSRAPHLPSSFLQPLSCFSPNSIHFEAELIASQELNKFYAPDLFHSIAFCQYDAVGLPRCLCEAVETITSIVISLKAGAAAPLGGSKNM